MGIRELSDILKGTDTTITELRKYADSAGLAYFYKGQVELAGDGKGSNIEGPLKISQPCSFPSVAVTGAQRLSEGEAYKINFLSGNRVGAVKKIYP